MAHGFNAINAHNDLRARLLGVQELKGYRLIKDPDRVPRDPSGLVYARLITLDRVVEGIEDLHLRDVIVEADESDHDVSSIMVVGVHWTVPDFYLLTIERAGLDNGSHYLTSPIGGVHVIGRVPSIAFLVQCTLDPE
jgi:hypothetical protein